MNWQKAISLIRDLSLASSEVTKAVNSGKSCKGFIKRERAAASALFKQLTGQKPVDSEIDRMVGG